MTYYNKIQTSFKSFVPKKEVELPEDFTTDWISFSDDVCNYLGERGIGHELAREYGLGYSEVLDRLILPNYGCIGQLIGWQGRAMQPYRQEYIGEGRKAPFFSTEKLDTPVIIVESQLCAMRIGLYTQAVAVLGNIINDDDLLEIATLQPEFYCLWLDKDRGGLYGINNLIKRLSNYGKVVLHHTEKDPKWLLEEELQQELRKIYDKGTIHS